MKVSKGQSRPKVAADIRLLNSLHGSGYPPTNMATDRGSLQKQVPC